MKRLMLAMAGLGALAMSAAAQPVITGVYNNSSFLSSNLPNGGIAEGSIIAIKGKGLGPSTFALATYPLTTTLGGTSVKVTVNGTTVNVPLYYAGDSQVAGVLPSNTPVGTGTVTVTYNNQTSATAPIKVVTSSFGISTISGSGAGQALVQNFVANAATLPINTPLAPANPGQTEILYGTGLGPVTFDETKPASSGDVGGSNFQLYVGGQLATVSYKGRSACCSGLDQVNFIVPQGVSGCSVPVTAVINGVNSNFANISVAPAGQACTDPTGLSGSDFAALNSGGNVRLGLVNLSRSVTDMGTDDSAFATFVKYNADQFVRSTNSLGGTPTLGSCTVYSYDNISSALIDPFAPTPLDAGPQIVINGPGGVQRTLKVNPQVSKGIYLDSNTTQSQYITPGTYSVVGAGGADVGAFNQSFTVGTPLTWTNKSGISTINRSQGLNVTWSGGDPNGYVIIDGSSTAFGSDFTSFVSASFTCLARVNAGQFTVPAYVLQALPATPASTGPISLNSASLSVGSYSAPSRFTAPGLDIGYITTGASTETSNVKYQ